MNNQVTVTFPNKPIPEDMSGIDVPHEFFLADKVTSSGFTWDHPNMLFSRRGDVITWYNAGEGILDHFDAKGNTVFYNVRVPIRVELKVTP
jgi:hypothetical protein